MKKWLQNFNVDKLFSLLEPIRLILFGALLTALWFNFNNIPKWMLLFMGLLIGIYVEDLINQSLLGRYRKIVKGYQDLLSELFKIIDEEKNKYKN